MNYLRIRNWEKYQKISGNKAPYVQVQTDILLDMDFMGLPDRERLCFLLLLCLAGRTQNKLPGDMSQVMHVCHFDDVPDVSLMIQHGLIEEWSEEKHTESIENTEDRLRYERERKRQWRDKKACPGNVPVMSRLERERETETERETERAVAAPKKPARKTQLKIETLPDDWQTYCKDRRPELNPDTTFENFRDFYLSHGRAMQDWTRTWQRWVRNEKPNGNIQHQPRETTVQARDRRNREAIERADRGCVT